MYICPLLTQKITLLTALSEKMMIFYIHLNDIYLVEPWKHDNTCMPLI